MKLNEFEKIAKMLAKEHRISIEPGNGWAANIKGRKVYYRKNDIYNLSEDHILGLILHEIAHIHYTSEVDMKGITNVELTHSTLNMIEDISIEHIISSDYPNAGEILESTKTEVLDTLLKILPKHKASVYEKALLFAATRFEGRGYAFGKEDYEKLGEKIADIMKIRKSEIFDRKHTKDLMPLVKTITDLMVQQAGEPSAKDKQEMMESGMHGHAKEGDHAQRQSGQSNNPNGHKSAKRAVIDALKGGKGWLGDADIRPQLEFIDAIADQAPLIGRRLRTVLKRNNSMEYAGRFRTGKLPTRRLSRVKIMKDRNPFARRIIKSNQSYAFAVASDVSGSMFDDFQFAGSYGSKDGQKASASYALTSMQMVGEALRMAGIPRALAIFGDRTNVVAPMGKAPINFQELANEKALKKSGPGGTDIAIAMNACIDQLKTVRAERKIMIILTDGGSDLMDMQDAHKRAIKEGIEPLGITVGTSSGNYMDKVFTKQKNRTIRDNGDTSEIGIAFIDILKESVKLANKE